MNRLKAFFASLLLVSSSSAMADGIVEQYQFRFDQLIERYDNHTECVQGVGVLLNYTKAHYDLLHKLSTTAFNDPRVDIDKSVHALKFQTPVVYNYYVGLNRYKLTLLEPLILSQLALSIQVQRMQRHPGNDISWTEPFGHTALKCYTDYGKEWDSDNFKSIVSRMKLKKAFSLSEINLVSKTGKKLKLNSKGKIIAAVEFTQAEKQTYNLL